MLELLTFKESPQKTNDIDAKVQTQFVIRPEKVKVNEHTISSESILLKYH